MNIPQLQESRTFSRSVSAFIGYNENLEIENNEFADDLNVTADSYPVLRQRDKRYTRTTENSDERFGLLVKDGHIYEIIDQNGTYARLYKDGVQVTGASSHQFASGTPQKMVSMGTKICFFPAFIAYNTVSDTWEDGHISISVKASPTLFHAMSIQPCKYNGEMFDGTWKFGASRPPQPTESEDYFADTTINVAYKWDEDSSSWIEMGKVYTRIDFESTNSSTFNPFASVTDTDSLTFSFASGTSPEATISWIAGNHSVIRKPNNNVIVVDAFPKNIAAGTEQTAIEISRNLPSINFDFVIEHNNRLFACYYGTDGAGGKLNEIYVSALGDPWNWYCYQGISTDSYTVSLGSDGPFTGAIVYNGYPTFFKENYIHRIFGQYPSNYQLDTTQTEGVMRGCSKSLVIVNGVLYYKSARSFVGYTSGIPVSISSNLRKNYGAVVGAKSGDKIYYSCIDDNRNTITFVYDTYTRTWHKESLTRFIFGDTINNNALVVTEDNPSTGVFNYALVCTGDPKQSITPSPWSEESSPIEWSFESGVYGLFLRVTNNKGESIDTEKEYINRINLNLQLKLGSEMTVYASYDGGPFEYVTKIMGNKHEKFSVPIKPKRCDHFRLRFVGKGEFKLYSLTQNIIKGSDKS